MQEVGYVDINFIMEKVKEEELPNAPVSEAKVKEWIFELLRKLNKIELYEYTTEEFDIVNKEITLPGYVKHIIKIEDKAGNRFTHLKSRGYYKGSKDTYMLRGRRVLFDIDKERLVIDFLKVPVDKRGNPLVLDNTYVISAVLSFVLYKVARRLWLTNRMSGQKYQEIEQDYLFYIGAAGEDLSIPSFDEMEQWDSILLGFPPSRMSES